MKIYIAGAMKNHPDYPAYFKAAQNRLETQGLVVLNPATLPQGMESADYMAICLAMVSRADVVALLPGGTLGALAMALVVAAREEG